MFVWKNSAPIGGLSIAYYHHSSFSSLSSERFSLSLSPLPWYSFSSPKTSLLAHVKTSCENRGVLSRESRGLREVAPGAGVSWAGRLKRLVTALVGLVTVGATMAGAMAGVAVAGVAVTGAAARMPEEPGVYYGLH